jgi:glycine cleavage system H protein
MPVKNTTITPLPRQFPKTYFVSNHKVKYWGYNCKDEPNTTSKQHTKNRRDQEMNIPAHLKFSTSDEWVNLEGKIATIGVTDFAQSQLSDIVYVEITVESGDAVAKNTAVATLESVKAAADVNSPVSGTVKEINETLSGSPELINSDPYGAWLVKLEINDPNELTNLMDAAAYSKYCAERSH